MKTDRELLELAAKAAGINALYWNDGSEPYSSGEGIIYGDNHIWNPLTDDGDALRLAVKLRLGYRYFTGVIEVVAWGKNGHERCFDYMLQKDENLECATRRAIVRAAAAIGETL